MCGITGVISLANKPILKTDLKRMCDIIAHRGPDDAGYLLFDSNLNFHPLTDSKFRGFSPTLNLIENAIEDGLEWKGFLGHRRLSIIDVSSAGHQPMSDRDKRVWIVFNGEIYNFKELRAELIREGYKFKTQSDTEVLIQAYLHWGINFIHHLNGMFAIGLIDSFAKKVYLIRDRYGIKPLYYCFYDESTIGFSSEIKSLVIYDESIRKVDKEAFLEYFTFQNIFTDKTFFQQVKLLPSASFLEIDLVTKKHNRISYWDYTFQEPTTSIQLKSYLNDLDDLFTQAVKRQMVSDVEVGSFLSGGIDSGAITSIATQYTDTLKTFTIGFDLNSASGIELGFDEREKSEFMSYLYKTEHYEMVLKSGDMERCLQSFSWHLEEPRVGQSYPNFYAAKLAGKFVKVVLSGTGGDELFGGYPWRYYRAAINNNFDDYINKYYNFWQRLIPSSELMQVFSPIWNDVKHISTRDIFKNVFLHHSNNLSKPEDYINHSLYFEAKTFLHGLLVVEDKLSMAHSLESRVPFLDNDLVDYAMKIPVNLKLGNLKKIIKMNENQPGLKTQKYFQKTNDGKLVLRQMLNKYVPDQVTNMVKQGFSSPDQSWFKGESISFVKDKIGNKRAKIYQYMNPRVVNRLVGEHLNGKVNRRLLIWSLLNFEEWLHQNEI